MDLSALQGEARIKGTRFHQHLTPEALTRMPVKQAGLHYSSSRIDGQVLFFGYFRLFLMASKLLLGFS